MLDIDPLDSSSLYDSANVLARLHSAARARGSAVPEDGSDPETCAHALTDLLERGHHGFAARHGSRCVGVLCGRASGRYAILPAEGTAVDPGIADATTVLGPLYAALAPRLISTGALVHHAKHPDWPPLNEAFANLGFGRVAVYATQPARSGRRAGTFEIREGSSDDLESIAVLSHIEMMHRFTAPIYAPPHPARLDDVRAHHVRLLEAGAVHLIASLGSEDIGLLTLERCSPAPRLCPKQQPYIGPTAVEPAFRGRGVGTELVEAALEWAISHGQETVSVDFQAANPLSRPFWLGAGFQTAGYEVARAIPDSYGAVTSW